MACIYATVSIGQEVVSVGITYRLVKNPRHAVHEKLEVLGSVQPSEVMAIVIFWWHPATVFWNRIEEQNKEELQAVNHQDLFGILPHDMVVRNAPCCRVIFHSLLAC